MNVFWIILAASPVLLLGVVAFFVFIVAGIRRGDRGDLYSPHGNRLDVITRRATGLGVRKDADDKEGDS